MCKTLCKHCASVQANKQIEQMVMFIKQEAEEKANEISMSAEEVWHPFSSQLHALNSVFWRQ